MADTRTSGAGAGQALATGRVGQNVIYGFGNRTREGGVEARAGIIAGVNTDGSCNLATFNTDGTIGTPMANIQYAENLMLNHWTPVTQTA
jgi:hypothetical protein